MTRKFRSTPLHALLAAAVLGLLVMPLAFAGAQAPKAQSSATVTAAKFKQLKKRIAALEARGGGQGQTTPTGPAGGDLTGTYPNPEIGQNTVGTNEVSADSLTAADFAPNSVTESEVATNAVGADELAPTSVGTDEIGPDTVGSDELKGIVNRVSPAGAGSNNTFVENSVTCANGEVLLAGGYAWQNDAAIDMTFSAPSEAVGNAWIVRGRSATANSLYAWAKCLAV